ncbi:hypothetical protein SAMN05443247_05887 [Bradyrhizobium erythrophlei]|nr:hypothetical protein SAMN05443247_05887 [Bradyrhizobium erythrophlei]
MCNLYSITTNQAAIIPLFRVVNRYVGNLALNGPLFTLVNRWPNPILNNWLRSNTCGNGCDKRK